MISFRKNFLAILGLLVSFESYTAGSFNLPPTDFFTLPEEAFLHDLSQVSETDWQTGAVTPKVINGITEIFTGMEGDLHLGKNYFYYLAPATNINIVDEFSVRYHLKTGGSFALDYTAFILQFGDIIQLLEVPYFTISTSSTSANFLISAYDRETNRAVTREDMDVTIGGGIYAPRYGTVEAEPQLNGAFYYYPNPGFSGVDQVLIFVRDKNGKMGYQFYDIFVNR